MARGVDGSTSDVGFGRLDELSKRKCGVQARRERSDWHAASRSVRDVPNRPAGCCRGSPADGLVGTQAVAADEIAFVQTHRVAEAHHATSRNHVPCLSGGHSATSLLQRIRVAATAARKPDVLRRLGPGSELRARAGGHLTLALRVANRVFTDDELRERLSAVYYTRVDRETAFRADAATPRSR